ncbi:MAG: SpoIIE family protein phosphatase [Spirochaetia bacterium]|nr:SpoIIE family protein phosphatase [Spirochaetia bacterium]
MRIVPVVILACALVSCAADKADRLHGQWEYRMGFDEAWLVNDPGGWKPVGVPVQLQQALHLSGYQGWITVRRRLDPKSAYIEREPAVLNMGWNSDVSMYFLDSVKIGQVGSVEPYRPGSYRNAIFSVPVIAPRSEHTLTAALYTNGQYPLQIFGPDLELGPAAMMQSLLTGREIVSFMLLAAYLLVGGYHLLLFAFRRKDKHNLFFGAFCILLTLYWLFRTNYRDQIFGDHILVRVKTEYIALFMIGPALIFFLSQYFERRYSRVGLALLCAWLVLAVIVAVTPNYHLASQMLQYWQMSALLAVAYVVYYMTRQAVRGNKDARWLLFGFVIFSASIIHDVFAALLSWDTPFVARFFFILFVLGIAAVLANRFSRMHNQVEELNEHLEEKVKERTEQLNQTLHRVEELKVQQDGDYFLTSLLIHPLSGNFAEGRRVSIDMLIRQKKTFRFKHWEAEIGGDLISVYDINLRGKKYVVFLNGDAMGKSMQGAGGALVLGTVFKSIVTRTQASAYFQNRYPEQWLKEMFLELQGVFVSFDGSMLVSAVFGLVEEDTGMVYYVNAEHPFVVLYHGQTASFVDKSIELRKLGIDWHPGSLQVRTLRLKHGNVLIIGSDGRDDVTIGYDARGNRLINEDEQLFLRNVERGGGELAGIDEAISQSGELTDDLTLLRIAYDEDAPLTRPVPIDTAVLQAGLHEARTARKSGEHSRAIEILRNVVLETGHYAAVKTLVKMLIAVRQFPEAAQMAVDFSEKHPERDEFLFLASFAMARMRRLEEALDFAERYRLRNPDEPENLVHLARLHFAAGRPRVSEKLLQHVLEGSPADAKAKALLDKIQGTIQ